MRSQNLAPPKGQVGGSNPLRDAMINKCNRFATRFNQIVFATTSFSPQF